VAIDGWMFTRFNLSLWDPQAGGRTIFGDVDGTACSIASSAPLASHQVPIATAWLVVQAALLLGLGVASTFTRRATLSV